MQVRFLLPAPFVPIFIGTQGKQFRITLKRNEVFVYILECKDSSLYTGITWDLKKRIKEHNLIIKSCLQKSKVPVKLVYWEKFKTKQEAAKREKEIKGWSRKKKEELIKSLH